VPTGPADPADQRVPARRHARRRVARLATAFGFGATGLALAVLAIIYVGGALVQGVARGLVLLPRAGIWLFVAMQDGAGWWTIAGRAGAALADALVTPQVTFWLIGLELVGAAALFALQRLFRDEERRTGSEEVQQ
jgi:hypothetical protein